MIESTTSLICSFMDLIATYLPEDEWEEIENRLREITVKEHRRGEEWARLYSFRRGLTTAITIAHDHGILAHNEIERKTAFIIADKIRDAKDTFEQ